MYVYVYIYIYYIHITEDTRATLPQRRMLQFATHVGSLDSGMGYQSSNKSPVWPFLKSRTPGKKTWLLTSRTSPTSKTPNRRAVYCLLEPFSQNSPTQAWHQERLSDLRVRFAARRRRKKAANESRHRLYDRPYSVRFILLMDKILHYFKYPKLWELWYIPYNG